MTIIVVPRTPQELFDTAVRGIAEQRGPAFCSSGCQAAAPQYRDELTGRRCAIGHCLSAPGELAGDQQSGIVTLLKRGIVQVPEGSGITEEMLLELQVAHDASWSPQALRKNFHHFAERHSLDKTALRLLDEAWDVDAARVYAAYSALAETEDPQPKTHD